MILNQNPERLNPQTLNALLTNRSHLLASALNSHAAALVTKEWGRRVAPEGLTGLARSHFVAQVTHAGELSRPFALRGIRVEDVAALPEHPDAGAVAGAVELREAASVIEHPKTLDDRILAALCERRREGTAVPRGRGEHGPGEGPDRKPESGEPGPFRVAGAARRR